MRKVRPIVARALLNKIDLYNSSNKTSNLPVGTIFYWAASSKEPAPNPIPFAACKGLMAGRPGWGCEMEENYIMYAMHTFHT